MTILVLGAAGQVGSHLRQRLQGAAVFWTRQEADLAQPEAASQAVRRCAPRIVVNCAAYTAVDQAESEPALAWRVNAESPARIAQTCADLGIGLIHLSTDYVFDGAREGAYRESDGANPINVYGRSKLAGDLAVTSLCTTHWILRTSWVFSEHGGNFVKTMLRVGSERQRVSVVDDQQGRPSYAGDLAELIVRLLGCIETSDAPAAGVYHTGGGPGTTWYGFAQRIFAVARRKGLIAEVPDLMPIATSSYPTPARRAANTLLQPNVAFQQSLGVAPDWLAGLDHMLDQLNPHTPA